VEPIVEDIRIVTLRKDRQIIAWLKFIDVAARNKFILGARPVIRSPDTYGGNMSPWSSKTSSLFSISPKFARKNQDISIDAFLLKSLACVTATKAETQEIIVGFEPGCCGIGCATDGYIFSVAKGSQACLAGIEVGMKIVRINGKTFGSMLEMDVLGGSKNFVDGEEAYQEQRYQVACEKTALPDGTSPLKGTDALKSNTSPVIEAITDGLGKLRRIGQAVDGWMLNGAPEKLNNCRNKDFYNGGSRCSASTAYASTTSALLSRNISGASSLLTIEEMPQTVSFALSERTCDSFALSESHMGAASYCAMTDFNSFRPASVYEDLEEMYDDLDFSKADITAMYDGLDTPRSSV
jgi:hypothetical protein